MSVLGKLRHEISRFGLGNGLLYVLAYALQSATSNRCRIIKYRFVAQPVSSRALSPERAGRGSVVRRVGPDEPVVAQFPRPEHVIKRRFADGAVCFVAEKDGELAGFIWIQPGSYMEDEVRCLYVLEPMGSAAWDFDVWVAPQFRFTRAFARLWDAANSFMRDRGYAWSVSRISAFNPESLAAHRRLGIRQLCTGVFVLLGKVQVALISRAPYVHIALSRQQHPVLHLHLPPSPAVLDISSGTASPGRTVP
jgi:hypothetical protein